MRCAKVKKKKDSVCNKYSIKNVKIQYSGQEPECADLKKEDECAYFAKKGECDEDPEWMEKYCKFTCGLCPGN